MVTNDKISVIIPTYNREKLVARSIESVLAQTYRNIEVIVVDDASTDNTKQIISKIKDNRLKYIRLRKNKGACYARNTGIKNATGKYIAFQDSDDVFHSDKLEKQLSNLISNKSDLDFCKIKLNLSDDNFLIIPNDVQDKELEENKIINLLCKGNFISTQAILAKRKIFDNITFDEELPRLQDYDLIMRIASKYKVSYTKEVLVDLYRQNDSISNSVEKLKKSYFVISSKDYGFDKKQRNMLLDSLLSHIIFSETSELSTHYIDLENNYQNLNSQYSKLLIDYNELLKRHSETCNELQHANESIKQIIHSKGWKLLEKIRRFIRIFK